MPADHPTSSASDPSNAKMTSVDPDYSPVSHSDPTSPDASTPVEDFPSSFLRDSKHGSKGGIVKDALFPKNYNARRRMGYVAMGATFLVVFGVATYGLGSRRGHIRTGGYAAHVGPWGYEGATVAPDAAVAQANAAGLQAMTAAGRTLTVSTWNIAAINNNPFEYWITYKEDPEYERIMAEIEKFIESPGDKDIEVNKIFTDDMFNELEKRMDGVGWDPVHKVRKHWEGDFRGRKIVSGFLKDPLLGSKRLASMPDRVTNTINVDGQAEPVCRPTVINMYDGDLSSLDKWWKEWEKFLFDTSLTVGGQTLPVYQMLRPIKRSKYPDVTEEEEAISLPLQTMCGAIFDAILVHMMNSVSEPDKWQNLKRTMVQNLNKQKVPHTLEILQQQYAASDVITLQEVSVSFIEQAKASSLSSSHYIVAPAALDAVRDQNSVIMLNRATFPDGALSEISSVVEGSFPKDAEVPVAKGDVLAITARDRDAVPYVIASFHGDTNGLATKPVLDALVRTLTSDASLTAHTLVFGLDANTYERAKPGKQQDVLDFGSRFNAHGLTSAWGDSPQPSNYTTFNARTYLQPQLNKACKSTEKRAKGDVNPKDFILFKKGDFEVVKTWKDNTGKGGVAVGSVGVSREEAYIEDMAFPTLNFPSDHGILSTVLRPRPQARR